MAGPELKRLSCGVRVVTRELRRKLGLITSVVAHDREMARPWATVWSWPAMAPDADNGLPGTGASVSHRDGILEYYVRLTPQNRLVERTTDKLAVPARRNGGAVFLHWPAEAGVALVDDGGRQA